MRLPAGADPALGIAVDVDAPDQTAASDRNLFGLPGHRIPRRAVETQQRIIAIGAPHGAVGGARDGGKHRAAHVLPYRTGPGPHYAQAIGPMAEPQRAGVAA